MVDVRVTKDQAQVLLDQPGPIRVTRDQAQVHYADMSNPIRVTRQQAQAHMAVAVNPVRITRQVVQVLRSVAVLPPVRPTLRQIDKQREANPFKPTLPRELARVNDRGIMEVGGVTMDVPDVNQIMPMMTEYMSDQAMLIRQQHNVTQAGDSTVPWEFLTRIGPQRLYTLGSLGRFYHDDHGIIVARYCQFSQIKAPEWLNGPCGRLNVSNEVDWKVTNDFDLSSADNVVGFIASYTVPNEGDYGWIVTEGANVVPILMSQLVNEVKNQDPLIWTGFEKVSTAGEGRVIGRVVGQLNIVNKAQHQLDIGAAHIAIEGPSPDSVKALVLDDLGDIEGRQTAIEESIKAIEASNPVATLQQLTEQVKVLGVKLTSEILQRGAADFEVNAAIQALQALVGDVSFAVLITQLKQEQGVVDSAQDKLIAKAQARADAAYLLLQGFDITELQTTLNALFGLIDKAKTKLIPVVDGSIPPQLVYLPTGELVFVEIEL